MIVYCFRQNPDEVSREYHIEQREKYKAQDGKYYIKRIKIKTECEMDLNSLEDAVLHHNPLTDEKQKFFSEKEMRYACAYLGRCVCGTCVSTLYRTIR